MKSFEKIEMEKANAIMEELEQEWQRNNSTHKARRYDGHGIKSSQISALVRLLVRKGVL